MNKNFVFFVCIAGITAAGICHAQSTTAQGIAVIRGTGVNSPITGTVKFKETENGLSIEAEVNNVPDSGLHGFHIHEFGSCAELGKAAGGHYNPEGAPHGLLSKDGHEHAHAGDMGNIEIDATGKGTLSAVLANVGLTNGKFNVAGRAVVLHEKADDFGQPTGNAGGRIGCGTIIVAEEDKIIALQPAMNPGK